MINLLSLISLLQAAPGISPDTSVSIEQDFSALLTELAGDFGNLVPQTVPPEIDEQNYSSTAEEDPGSFGSNNSNTAAANDPGEFPLPVGFVTGGPASLTAAQPAAAPQFDATASLAALFIGRMRLIDQASDPSDPVDPIMISDAEQTTRPEAAEPSTTAILKDLQKVEVTVRHEAVQAPEMRLPIDMTASAVVTTDPIARVRQSQSPLRVLPVQSISVEVAHAERNTEPPVESTDVLQPGAAFQPGGIAPSLETMEQPRPMQLIEVPAVPKLQVVRTVSMEVGDGGSRVIVRIEDRGGTMNLHFGTGNDTLHRILQSSVGSLVYALKQQRIDVSNVGVTRKAAMDKVQRMKEAH